jgi:hypothetical protein
MGHAADALDAWYAGGRQGPRSPGRLRNHPRRRSEVGAMADHPVYDLVYDPDGRPWRMRAWRGV